MVSKLKKYFLLLVLMAASKQIYSTCLTITNKHAVEVHVEIQDQSNEERSLTFNLEPEKPVSLNTLFDELGFSKNIYVIYGNPQKKFLLTLNENKPTHFRLVPPK